MYKRSKKDDYRKRIEEMIGGSQKCSRESSANNNNIDNYNTNISNDTTSVMDCSINDSNDVYIARGDNVIAVINTAIHNRGGVINNIDNYNTNISNDTTSVMDCSINDSNDVVASSDINDSSSGINDNAKNDELNMNNIRVQRWNPVSTRVKGIRKYLEANKINLNNLITKLL